MAYLAIDNFAAGLDTRKSALTSAPGTLQRLVNAVVTPGGEISKRRAFVKIATLTGTFGLASTENAVYAFTRNVAGTPPVIAVPGVTLIYQTIPNTAGDLVQTDFDVYDGKIYLACDQPSGATPEAKNPHYYDGFLTEGAGKGRYVRSYRSKIYSVEQRNLFFSVLDNPVLWNDSSIASSVTVTNLSKSNPAVCTVAAGDIGQFSNAMLVYITGAAGTGLKLANGLHTISSVNTPANTFVLDGVNTSTATAAQTNGNVKATPAIPVTNLSKSYPAVCTVSAANVAKLTDGLTVQVIGAVGAGLINANGEHTISSVNSPANTFTLAGVDTSAGAAPQTTGVAITIVADVNRTGQGFINLSAQDADSEKLTSLEVYYDKLGVFSSEATQLWGVDPDPAQNALSQILRQSGTRAPLSTQQYGSGDVLFLAQSGVRSVRARDSSNAAAVSDIGSPIDSLMQELYVTRGEAYFSKGRALLEPIVGRFWMTFEDEFYSLSAFPGPKITAWSYHRFSADGVPFKATYVVTSGDRVFVRDDADNLYVYGGNDGNRYDNCHVEIRLPYLDMGKPGTNKVFQGLDLTVTGNWTVKNSFDYNNPDAEETLGVFSAPTWRDGKAAFQGQSTHFSLRLYNDDDSPALLSNAAIHYALAGEES